MPSGAMVAVALALLGAGPGPDAPGAAKPDAEAQRAKRCEQRLRNLAWSAVGRPGETLALVEAERASCEGTGVYELTLVTSLAVAGRVDEARALLASVPKRDGLADFTEVALDLVTSMSLRPAGPADFRRIEGKLEAVLQRWPDQRDALNALAALKAARGDHLAAVALLERSARKDPSDWAVQRSLTLSYAAVGRYRDALAAGRPVAEANPGAFQDLPFVLAVLTAEAGLGQAAKAKQVLDAFAARNPGFEADEDFRKTRAFVEAKLREQPAPPQR